jgi:hypothetical protein
MTLKERIDSAIADLDSQIARVQADASAKVAALSKKKATLEATRGLVTEQIEGAFTQIKSLGIDL